MDILDSLQRRVEEFNEGLKSGFYVTEILQENEAFIINFNTEVQLYEQGVNNLGVSISDYAPYAEYTIAMKEMNGQPYDRVTLHDQGDFSGSFYMEIGTEMFEIKAADIKTAELIEKYGRQILGLTTENIKSVIWDYIYPELSNQRNKLIYGK